VVDGESDGERVSDLEFEVSLTKCQIGTGTRHGYGFSVGRNFLTQTHTHAKTMGKPAGLPIPLLYTRNDKLAYS